MLVWIDLETTGLKAGHDHILEVAAVITDDYLQEIARFERVCFHPASKDLAELAPDCTEEQALALSRSIDPFVVRMHATNGLWKASATYGEDRSSVDDELAKFIDVHTSVDADPTSKTYGKKLLPQLAGSTISFDRAFLAIDFPATLDTLHYRNLDVSTLNEVAKRYWPEVYEARPRAANVEHRGMSDILLSIEAARYYTKALQPVPAAPPVADNGGAAVSRIMVLAGNSVVADPPSGPTPSATTITLTAAMPTATIKAEDIASDTLPSTTIEAGSVTAPTEAAK